MTKIKCNTLTPSLDAQKYKTPKGNEYEFHRGIFIDVKDPEDALFFLKAGGENPFFSTKSKIVEVKKGLKAAIKKLKKKKDVDEDEAPEETGALEPTVEDLEVADGEEIPIEDQDPNLPELAPEEAVDNVDNVDAPEEPAGEAPTPIDEISPELKEKLDKSVDVTPDKEVFTYNGLKELNAKEQTYMIKQCTKDAVPRRESERINLLLKLQKEGSDLLEIQKGYQA